ncbi:MULTISPECIES: isochorismate synthase [Cyanophyceae]|uniref:isochorismate synthase n=1 Tax=Cyanophyceae TaxID=3028117 RepID=UPI00232F7466|nr:MULTISPECIES: isochorismate synthase MenF [Cyanophyceae]MDB9357540.1 isochorismate synthase MenF [Nodularia spumigena CS-587/03]MDB9306142.1 isochorismate synthase MenF [Nodularia spumigena CS-591/12]MDB9319807.1 isochorismate synthase MenF [Nodularia spumigena CS-590/01A]MDB9322062.1 isochorismate synthase MenF [Nodularia spumigena CS-591/07A]MDB9327664.1 isochorismate synthase MenF [Nodularia spumigena CS-590/02]
MTVLPCRSNLFVKNKDLYHFLLNVQENCRNHNCRQIVSISLDIEWVDPLVVLDRLTQANDINFYFENKAKGEAIAGIDTVTKLEIDGKERFNQAEYFIKSCLKNIINFGNNQLTFAEPHFFCYFSFFDYNSQIDYPFPSATVFLPRWQISVKNKRCILVNNIIIKASTNVETILQNLQDKIVQIQSLEYASTNLEQLPTKFSKQSVTNAEDFKRAVGSAVEKIRSSHLSKIVLANALDVKSNHNFNLFKSLNNLRQIHPNCYIFSTSNGKGQNFIGASPERLISIQNQELISDALAGSAPRGKTPAEDAANANRLLNSIKERHEHSLVIDFITQRLTQLGLLPQVLAPRLRQLSNIQHLWTPITATVPANVHPLKIVSQLHPTPAVAGATRDFACAEIRRYESFERGLYAAPLGWVDARGNCEFIVGIRSALIDGDRARLYAGAGIVAGSDPEKEFAEVQLKLQALLKALV